MTGVTIAKGLASLAVVGAILAANTVAQAQPATNNSYYYDPCRRDQVQRGTTGGILGAIIGGVIGDTVAANPAKTEGAGIGALIGAAVGSGVGQDSDACIPAYSAGTGYSLHYAARVQGGYYDAPQADYAPPPPAYYYAPARRHRGYGRGYGYRYPQAYVAPPVSDRYSDGRR